MQGNEITQTIARNISTARKSRGLTQRGLAEAINHSETAVRFWESGRREIGNEAMLALSKALGYKWGWFFQDQTAATAEEQLPVEQRRRITEEEFMRRMRQYFEFERKNGTDGDSLTVCGRDLAAKFNTTPKSFRTLLAPRLDRAQNVPA